MTDTDSTAASPNRCIRYGDTISLVAHNGRYLGVTRGGRVVGGSASQGEASGRRAPFSLPCPACDRQSRRCVRFARSVCPRPKIHYLYY